MMRKIQLFTMAMVLAGMPLFSAPEKEAPKMEVSEKVVEEEAMKDTEAKADAEPGFFRKRALRKGAEPMTPGEEKWVNAEKEREAKEAKEKADKLAAETEAKAEREKADADAKAKREKAEAEAKANAEPGFFRKRALLKGEKPETPGEEAWLKADNDRQAQAQTAAAAKAKAESMMQEAAAKAKAEREKKEAAAKAEEEAREKAEAEARANAEPGFFRKRALLKGEEPATPGEKTWLTAENERQAEEDKEEADKLAAEDAAKAEREQKEAAAKAEEEAREKAEAEARANAEPGFFRKRALLKGEEPATPGEKTWLTAENERQAEEEKEEADKLAAEAAAKAEREQKEAAARAEREQKEAAARAEREQKEAAAKAEREQKEAAARAEEEAREKAEAEAKAEALANAEPGFFRKRALLKGEEPATPGEKTWLTAENERQAEEDKEEADKLAAEALAKAEKEAKESTGMGDKRPAETLAKAEPEKAEDESKANAEPGFFRKRALRKGADPATPGEKKWLTAEKARQAEKDKEESEKRAVEALAKAEEEAREKAEAAAKAEALANAEPGFFRRRALRKGAEPATPGEKTWLTAENERNAKETAKEADKLAAEALVQAEREKAEAEAKAKLAAKANAQAELEKAEALANAELAAKANAQAELENEKAEAKVETAVKANAKAEREKEEAEARANAEPGFFRKRALLKGEEPATPGEKRWLVAEKARQAEKDKEESEERAVVALALAEREKKEAAAKAEAVAEAEAKAEAEAEAKDNEEPGFFRKRALRKGAEAETAGEKTWLAAEKVRQAKEEKEEADKIAAEALAQAESDKKEAAAKAEADAAAEAEAAAKAEAKANEEPGFFRKRALRKGADAETVGEKTWLAAEKARQAKEEKEEADKIAAEVLVEAEREKKEDAAKAEADAVAEAEAAAKAEAKANEEPGFFRKRALRKGADAETAGEKTWLAAEKERLAKEEKVTAEPEAVAVQGAVVFKNSDNLTVSGDLRIRHESRKRNYVDPAENDDSRNRLRTRFRLGLDFKTPHGWSVHAGLASGGSDGTSTNDTWNEDSVWETGDIRLDYAYAKHSLWKGATILAGQQKNPYINAGIFWDDDLRPTGITAQQTLGMAFVTSGYYNLAYYDDSGLGEMWGIQTGIKKKGDVSFTAIVSYYVPNDRFDDEVFGKGAKYQYEFGSLYGDVSFKHESATIKLFAEVGESMGADSTSITLGGDSLIASEAPIGYSAGDNNQHLTAGVEVKASKVKAKVQYVRVEGDAALAYVNGSGDLVGLSNSDFGMGMGVDDLNSDVEGVILGAAYSFSKNCSLGVTVMDYEAIKRKPRKDGQLIQIDLKYKF